VIDRHLQTIPITLSQFEVPTPNRSAGMNPTAAAYQGVPEFDRTFYDRIRDSQGRQLTSVFDVPVRSGKAWKVRIELKQN
jgi:hypothetical protein